VYLCLLFSSAQLAYQLTREQILLKFLQIQNDLSVLFAGKPKDSQKTPEYRGIGYVKLESTGDELSLNLFPSS